MRNSLLKIAPALALLLWGNVHATGAAKAKAAAAPAIDKEQKMLIGYYPNWGRYSGFTADKIPYGYLTHIIYAFYVSDVAGNLSNTDPLDADNFKELVRLCHEKGVKLLVSVGGAASSANFPALAASASARANFIKNCLKLVDQYQLDGIDIDWEYPMQPDGDNQLKLHREMRAALDKLPRKVLFTAAVPPTNWFAQWSQDESWRLLDYVNLMTYDFMGTWEKAVIPNSGMDQTRESLEYFEKRGVPRSKLVPGAAFYAKSFNDGTTMGSNYDGAGSGTGGIWQWKDLLEQFKAAPYKIHWDEKTQSEYAVGNEEIIVFNGLPSQRVRGEFVRNSDYPGVMLWDLSGDVPDPKKSLLVALYRGLRGTNRGPLVTPDSKP